MKYLLLYENFVELKLESVSVNCIEDKIEKLNDLKKKRDALLTTDEEGFQWQSKNPFKKIKSKFLKKKFHKLDREIVKDLFDIGVSKTLTIDEYNELCNKFRPYSGNLHFLIRMLFTSDDYNTPDPKYRDVIKYYMDQGYRIQQNDLHWDNGIIRDSEIDFLLNYDETYIRDFGQFMSDKMREKWKDLSRGSRAGLWDLKKESLKFREDCYPDVDNTDHWEALIQDELFKVANSISYMRTGMSKEEGMKTYDISKPEGQLILCLNMLYILSDFFTGSSLISKYHIRKEEFKNFCKNTIKEIRNELKYRIINIIENDVLLYNKYKKLINEENIEIPDYIKRSDKTGLWDLKKGRYEQF